MRLGQVKESKDGNTLYLEVTAEAPVTLKKGDILYLNKPADEIDSAVKRGKLTEEQATIAKGKVPSFVKRNVNLRLEKTTSAERF